MKNMFLSLLKGYQRIVSPYTLGNCRYIPSCSQYSYEALEKFGVVKGMLLTVRRLLKCRPFASTGFDPIP
jgi:putative membrane protein insertion efficiency factor